MTRPSPRRLRLSEAMLLVAAAAVGVAVARYWLVRSRYMLETDDRPALRHAYRANIAVGHVASFISLTVVALGSRSSRAERLGIGFAVCAAISANVLAVSLTYLPILAHGDAWAWRTVSNWLIRAFASEHLAPLAFSVWFALALIGVKAKGDDGLESVGRLVAIVLIAWRVVLGVIAACS